MVGNHSVLEGELHQPRASVHGRDVPDRRDVGGVGGGVQQTRLYRKDLAGRWEDDRRVALEDHEESMMRS